MLHIPYIHIRSRTTTTTTTTTPSTTTTTTAATIYIYTEEEAVGSAFWQPTIFSGFVCFEGLCVGFCVSWSPRLVRMRAWFCFQLQNQLWIVSNPAVCL